LISAFLSAWKKLQREKTPQLNSSPLGGGKGSHREAFWRLSSLNPEKDYLRRNVLGEKGLPRREGEKSRGACHPRIRRLGDKKESPKDLLIMRPQREPKTIIREGQVLVMSVVSERWEEKGGRK